MTGAESVTKQKQSSPRYPFIPLGKAIERAEQFRRAAGNNAALVKDARDAWNYAAKSSGGDQTIAALSYYGLLDDVGSGQNRKLKLSDAAQRYFRDERPEVRADLLARFAMAPKAMKKLWDMWNHEPPSDSVGRSILKVDLHYSDHAANELLNVYRENLQYIPRVGSDIVLEEPPPEGADRGEVFTQAKVGDFVQWTSGGVDQFTMPRKVIAVSEDGKFAQVHGSLTGISMNELTVVDSPKPASPAGGIPFQANTSHKGADINILMAGQRLQITADVDLEGVGKLKEALGKYEELLKLLQ